MKLHAVVDIMDILVDIMDILVDVMDILVDVIRASLTRVLLANSGAAA